MATIGVVSGPVMILASGTSAFRVSTCSGLKERIISISPAFKAAICGMGSLITRICTRSTEGSPALKYLFPAVHDEMITWDPFGEPKGAAPDNGLWIAFFAVFQTSIHLKRDPLWYQPLNAIG